MIRFSPSTEIREWTNHSEAGKAQGAINASNGHMQRIQKLGAPKGGKTQGAVNARNGHMKQIAHVRWHVQRGTKSNYCEFCFPEVSAQSA
jgi:hypothetical protein